MISPPSKKQINHPNTIHERERIVVRVNTKIDRTAISPIASLNDLLDAARARDGEYARILRDAHDGLTGY
jgi:hypothetical protein